MNNDSIQSAFSECLELILTEGASVESALEQYPQYEDELLPMLEAAIAAQRLGQSINVPQTAQSSSRALFLNRAHALSEPKTAWFSFIPLRLGFVTLVVLALLILGSLSTVVVSAQSLPGDTLYPVKILREKTQLFFTQDSNQRLELEREFDQQRAQEIYELIERSRSHTVNFAGEITRVGSNEWEISGIRLVIAPGTEVVDELSDGLYVGIEGILGDDGVVLVRKIWAREHKFDGEIEAIHDDRWLVQGVEVLITSETIIDGFPLVGTRVVVHATRLADGQFLARVVQVIGITPEVTDTERPTLTVEPTSGMKPSDTPEPTENDTPDTEEPDQPEESEEPDDTDEPEDSPEPTDDDDDEEATKTPKPTDDDDDDTPEPTDDDDDTPEPTDDDDDQTNTPEPTDDDDTPEPTDEGQTPKPTDDD